MRKRQIYALAVLLLLFCLMAVSASGAGQTEPMQTLPPLTDSQILPEPEWPERDADGFLADGREWYYENSDGLWVYLSGELQIVITHHRDSSIPLEWFETDIRTRGDETFRTVQTDPERPGKKFRYPYDIAKQAGFVLGFSDDFFANRMSGKETVGVIIRDGQILSEKTYKKRGHHLPNLDMMAQFPDGSFAVYYNDELTAQQLLQMGAVNVYSFGPWLIRDGECNPLLYGSHYRNLQPRQAFGMVEPGHYLLVSFQGRIKESKGTTLQRVAEVMKERGVTQALNLDGGNTMALVFRGQLLNKPASYKNKRFVRTVTSLIGIGYTE